MACELVLTPVVLEIRHVHAPEIEMELLAAEQSLARGVPVGRLDEPGVRLRQLELEAALRPFGDVEGELVRAVVERHQLLLM